MKCKVKLCDRVATYKLQKVCQKHYFRFMRHGTYQLTRAGKGAKEQVTPNGYRKLLDRTHPFSDHNGYVFEHRSVFYFHNKDKTLSCEFCGTGWSWRPYKDHVDHIDNDKLNNDISNLRALCNSCNTGRVKKNHSQNKRCTGITFLGTTLTAEEWSREEICKVNGYDVRNRIKSGWTISDAITKPSRKAR